MDALLNVVKSINSVLWGYILVFMLVGTGIFFTFKLKFVQIKKFGKGWKQLLGGFSLHGKKAGKEGMSSFQALATAIAAQVGTGNLAGAATAILSGGP
ncbi:MAG TPA: sodium:alanine symporter family protein, partial [Clostridiaceae bacterium]|nr:sodium:alanine symporter family protein [Clostridiaceae bacterium]